MSRPTRPVISSQPTSPAPKSLDHSACAPIPPVTSGLQSSPSHTYSNATPKDTLSFEALKQKHTELSQRRQRLAYQLEQAQMEVLKCQEYARTLGIETLEQFEAQLKVWAEQDAKAQEQLQRDLLAEEQRQQKTEETLKALQDQTSTAN